jgi:hypothetical protein
MKQILMVVLFSLLLSPFVFAQNVGINTNTPAAMLHVADSNVLFSGGAGFANIGPVPQVGPGKRFMWYASKAALRAGYVDGAEWDKDSIGLGSFASGVDNIAKGNWSFSSGIMTNSSGVASSTIGGYNTASGSYSFATGQSSTASGNTSQAMGYNTTATGPFSFSRGQQTYASGTASESSGISTVASGVGSFAGGVSTKSVGDYSFAYGSGAEATGYATLAFGRGVQAKAYSSVAIGRYNDTIAGSSSYSWELTDPLFAIGNGSSGALSNAMTVLKNGFTGLRMTDPQTTFHVGAGTDANYGNGSGYMVLGDVSTINVVFDNNEIVARNNGVASTLYLQAASGGDLITCAGGGFMSLGNIVPSFQLHLTDNSAAKPTSNTWTVASDARLKKDIHDYTDGLNKLMAIKPVWFTYSGEADLPQETGVGIIAQELKEIAPYMIKPWTYKGEPGKETEYLGVDNGAMTYMLINAVKEQQQLIETLSKKVEELQNKLQSLLAK